MSFGDGVKKATEAVLNDPNSNMSRDQREAIKKYRDIVLKIGGIGEIGDGERLVAGTLLVQLNEAIMKAIIEEDFVRADEGMAIAEEIIGKLL